MTKSKKKNLTRVTWHELTTCTRCGKKRLPWRKGELCKKCDDWLIEEFRGLDDDDDFMDIPDLSEDLG